jgi:hypothetical protein
MKNEGVTKINYPKPLFFGHENRLKMYLFLRICSRNLLINNKLMWFRKLAF